MISFWGHTGSGVASQTPLRHQAVWSLSLPSILWPARPCAELQATPFALIRVVVFDFLFPIL